MVGLKVPRRHVNTDDLHVSGVLCRVKMVHLHMFVGNLQMQIEDCWMTKEVLHMRERVRQVNGRVCCMQKEHLHVHFEHLHVNLRA